MYKKTIGIIGGMGPLATADLFKKIIIHTKASNDQEHIKILVDNNTDIPDRTDAILNNGKNPVPQLIKSAVSLWAMGAEILVMPCNTAHYFLSEIQKNVEIPILNMIEITADEISERGINTVGLLATEGTVKSGIYQEAFERKGIRTILPRSDEQNAITELIYTGVKANKPDYDVNPAKTAMASLVERGAEILVLGCTELPVACELYNLNYSFCDPTLELAKAAIRAAKKECV